MASVTDDNLSPWDLDWGGDLQKYVEDAPPAASDVFTPRVDEDDYSEEQGIILVALKKQIRAAVNVNTIYDRRKKAMHWCFVRGEKDRNGLTFHEACIALGSRPEVVQARIHYQYFDKGVMMRDALPLMTDLLPEQYESEALMSAWEEGLAVVESLWRWPGMPIPVLEEKMAGIDLWKVMDKLDKAGLVRCRFSCAYLIGRAPERIARRSFSWARSFL